MECEKCGIVINDENRCCDGGTCCKACMPEEKKEDCGPECKDCGCGE